MKVNKDGACLISSSRSFQSDRAMMAKAKFPGVLKLDLRISKRDPPEDLRLHLGSYRIRHSLIYSGGQSYPGLK